MSGARPAAIDNTALVPDYGYQSAIQILDFTDVLVRGNTAFDVGIAPAILLDGGHGGRVTGNVATRSRAGIRVAASTGLLVEKNDASGNLGSPDGSYPGEGTGIFVDSGNAVRRNTANDNDGFGIYAEPGVIDGGGNRASGNGVADCVNVICK
jgi:parallel beta-helix repeat protein